MPSRIPFVPAAFNHGSAREEPIEACQSRSPNPVLSSLSLTVSIVRTLQPTKTATSPKNRGGRSACHTNLTLALSPAPTSSRPPSSRTSSLPPSPTWLMAATPTRSPPPNLPRAAPAQGFSSSPQDTQAFPTSQYVDPNAALSEEVQDEVKEGVWGYLFPLDTRYGRCIVLKKRSMCPHPKDIAGTVESKKKKGNTKGTLEQEKTYEKSKTKGVPSGGYLIGRRPKCGPL
ncbi:hypothetical protein RRF57_010665 [Xylaria bambusicola]|uniref:Uncharacterized protein n=1 Tax=Xylaria bambusicola TaxID=326684 RepID=A0AAN7UWZ2_9PEZI